VHDFLGPDGRHHSVMTRELPPFEHVNLQTAVDAWSARGRCPRHRHVRGIAMRPHYGSLSLQQLVAGEALPPLRLTAPAPAGLPNRRSPTPEARDRAVPPDAQYRLAYGRFSPSCPQKSPLRPPVALAERAQGVDLAPVSPGNRPASQSHANMCGYRFYCGSCRHCQDSHFPVHIDDRSV
jgi:hypothetical protein